MKKNYANVWTPTKKAAKILYLDRNSKIFAITLSSGSVNVLTRNEAI
jgi:hypothetical protein